MASLQFSVTYQVFVVDIVRGGYVNQNTSNLFRNAGDRGNYWSSTPVDSSASNAYNLYFNSTATVNPSNNNNRQNGNSVRCPFSARSPHQAY